MGGGGVARVNLLAAPNIEIFRQNVRLPKNVKIKREKVARLYEKLPKRNETRTRFCKLSPKFSFVMKKRPEFWQILKMHT
jgi:hypothetical protein